MNDFACDQHTPQPFARHDELLERSYMVITQTALLHRCCKCLQLEGSNHTTPTLNRVCLALVGSIIIAGRRLVHCRNAVLDIRQTKCIELL